MRWQSWVVLGGVVVGGVLVVGLVGRLLPRRAPPGGVAPGDCGVAFVGDGGERLTPGRVYRLRRDVEVPLPDDAGAFTATCLTARAGWSVAVQRSQWWADPWLPGALRPGELGMAAGLPVATFRPYIWATSSVPERDFSGRVQSALIRAGLVETT